MRWFHLGPLTAGDIQLDLIPILAWRGRVSLDVQGLLVLHRGHLERIPAYLPNAENDPTGCGDTYMAGYFFQRLASRSPQPPATSASPDLFFLLWPGRRACDSNGSTSPSTRRHNLTGIAPNFDHRE